MAHKEVAKKVSSDATKNSKTSENDIKKRVNCEKNRQKRFFKDAGLEKKQYEMLLPVVENVAWMKVKLEDAREEIAEGKLVVDYDNGGGQSGVRENPVFKAYEGLWKAYLAGLSKILEIFPTDIAEKAVKEEVVEPQNVLSLVRGKRKEA